MKAFILIDFQKGYLESNQIIDAKSLVKKIDNHLLNNKYDYYISTLDIPNPQANQFGKDDKMVIPERLPPDCIPQYPTQYAWEVFYKMQLASRDGYSGFHGENKQNTMLDEYLKMNHINHLTLAGFALDYCIKQTAIDASKNYQVEVPVQLTRCMSLSLGLQALLDMRMKGIKII